LKKKNHPSKFGIWIEARKRFNLTDCQVQMARELGLNPKKFGSLAANKHEPWKSPLCEFIEHIYFKRFQKDRPERIVRLELEIKEVEARNKERRKRRRAEPQARTVSQTDT
jgi:hypothetical protein